MAILDNTFKPGPGTPSGAISRRILKTESERFRTVVDNFSRAHVSGNVVLGDERVTRDNWDGGVQPDVKEKPLPEALAAIRSDAPFPHAPLTIQSAAESYDFVLAHAGATRPRRDAVDTRVVGMVRSDQVDASARATARDLARSAAAGYDEASLRKLEEGVPRGFITNPAQVGGWPEYRGEPDTDGDGLPDEWETAHGLDPHDPSDATADLNGDDYANIEDFINDLDPRAPAIDWTDLRNNVDPRHAR